MGKVNPEKQQMGKIVITFPISPNFSSNKCCLQTVLSLLNDLYLENRDTRIPKRVTTFPYQDNSPTDPEGVGWGNVQSTKKHKQLKRTESNTVIH